MKVVVTSPFSLAGSHQSIGATLDIDISLARMLVRAGKARYRGLNPDTGGATPAIATVKPASYYGVHPGDMSDSVYNRWAEMWAAVAGDGEGGVEFSHGDYWIDGPAVAVRAGLEAGSYVGSESGFRAGLNVRGPGGRACRINMLQSGQGLLEFYAADPSTQWWDIRMSGFQLVGPGIEDQATFALQFGGKIAGKQHIVSGLHMDDLRFAGFHTHIRADDVTSWQMWRCFMEGFRYGIEANYNIDILQAIGGEIGDQAMPSGVNITFSTATPRTATMSAADAAKMRVGMVISSSLVPEGTRITAVDTAGAIAFDQDATGNGTTACDLSLGTFITYGQGPWIPATNSINASRGDCNAHVFQNMWFMRLEQLLDVYKNTTSNVKVADGYVEKCSKVATLGDPTVSSQGPLGIVFDNMFFSQPNYRTSAFKVVCQEGADTGLVVRNCRRSALSAAPAWGRQHWFESVGIGDIQLDWDNSNLYTGDANVAPINLGGRMVALGTNSVRFSYSVGLRRQPGYIHNVPYAALVAPDFSEGWCDGVSIGALTGNITIDPPTTLNLWKGFRASIYLLQDAVGGRTVTWNAQYKGPNASAPSLPASGNANQKAQLLLEFDGTRFVQIATTAWYA